MSCSVESSSDLESLVALYVECFNAPPWNDGWSREAAHDRIESMLQARHFRGWLDTAGSSAAGGSVAGGSAQGMILAQNERWVTGYHCNILEMCVQPTLQRRGIGAALLQQAMAELRAEGVENLYLMTAPNGPAESFYGKQQFRRSRGRVVLSLSLEAT